MSIFSCGKTSINGLKALRAPRPVYSCLATHAKEFRMGFNTSGMGRAVRKKLGWPDDKDCDKCDGGEEEESATLGSQRRHPGERSLRAGVPWRCRAQSFKGVFAFLAPLGGPGVAPLGSAQ